MIFVYCFSEWGESVPIQGEIHKLFWEKFIAFYETTITQYIIIWDTKTNF